MTRRVVYVAPAQPTGRGALHLPHITRRGYTRCGAAFSLRWRLELRREPVEVDVYVVCDRPRRDGGDWVHHEALACSGPHRPVWTSPKAGDA